MSKRIKGKTTARGLRPKKPATANRKKLKLWLVRQPASASVLLLQSNDVPEFTEDGALVQWQQVLSEFCAEDLEMYTGFKVDSGRCQRIHIDVTAIGTAILMQETTSGVV